MEKDLFDETSELFGSGQFIVLASQVDSQPAPAIDLPALQQGEEESCDSEVIYPIMEPSAAQSGSLVLVTDSEVEAVEKPRTSASSDGCVIGETASEDNMEQGRSTSNSDDAANITVIAREVAGEHQQDPLSQDLFAAKDDKKEDRPVATPSQHHASLQLSGQPMLVPETLEESLGDEEICPSPDVYSDMPHIIPSTPSLTLAGEGEETEYNPGEIQTLNSQQGKPVRKSSPDPQSLTESQKQASAGTSASASAAGLAGPTLAGELPEWQQSQSLCLLMTSSSSTSQPASHQQVGQVQSQPRTDSQAAFQSQDVKKDDMFAVSQNLRLGPVLSQTTAQPVSEAFSLSVPKPASESQTKTLQKGGTETTNTSSSKDSTAEVSVSWGPASKAAISIDMVLSQSQSASETTFKLERPEVGNGEKRGETEEASASQNVFQRTRQSRRIAAAKQTSSLSEDSEDMFANVGKAAGPQSLSDSDPIPCSQNRLGPPRPLVKQEERMDTVGEESEPAGDVADVYNVDTVMDSEPEDEGTQSYEVFPALSRNSSTSVSAPAEETEEAQVPQLLPSIPAVSPSPPREQSREEVTPSSKEQQASQSQPFSQRASQVAARLAQLSAAASSPQSSAPKKTSSQPAKTPNPLPAGRPRMSSQPVRTRTAVVHQQARSQTAAQQRLDPTGKGVVGDGSVELSRPELAAVGKDGDQVQSGGKKGTLSQAGREGAACRQLVHPDPDPYTFCGSQSQLVMEAEGTSTSRAETSISTAQTLKTKPKGLLGRRRKLLVKKKKEMNPTGQVKTSSTDDGTDSRTMVRPATRKAKKGEKLTGFQKTVTDDFKIPRTSVHSASRVKDNADVPTEVNAPSNLLVQRQSTVRISAASNTTATSSSPRDPGPVEPQASTSRVSEETSVGGRGGDSQDSQKVRKRKSVEFSNIVQIDSPPLPLNLEENFSDSQSSDTVLEVTEVTDFIMRLVKRRIVVRKIDKEGNIVHEKTSVKEGEPVLVEEINHTSKRRVAFSLSPSRSGSTLESGDLADISSSSLSNKASSGHSSLERGISSLELPPPAPLSSAIPLEMAGSSTVNTSSTSQAHSNAPWRISGEQTVPASLVEHMEVGEHSLGGRSSVGVSPAISFISPDQSAIERDDSRLEAVVTSSSSGLASEALYSADNKQTSSDLPCAQQPPQAASSSSSSGVVPPTADESSQKQQSRSTTRSSRKATRCAPADSSQEENRRGTNVTSSPETQSFLPGSESGGFSVSMSGGRKKTVGSGTSGTSSGKTGLASASSPKKSSHVRQSSQETPQRDITPVQVPTASKMEIGARVMCRWKDGFFYPAKFVGLNTGIGNKFKVLFEDGMEKMVRAVDLVMAQNLPLGQSVLVTGEDGVSDPGIIIRHVPDESQMTEKGEVLYDVAMDDGSTRKCRRSDLILSEDQASCLLSDDEYRATLGETDLALVNTADVSLDNVIQGKRSRTKGSPAVGVPRIVGKASTSSVPSDHDEHSDDDSSTTRKKAPSASSSRSGQSHDAQEPLAGVKTPSQTASTSQSSSRKRKTGSVATSTPIPKRTKTSERQRTPRKAEYSHLGGVVASPELPKRPTRKARVGLFENVKGPIPTNPGLFKGYVFLLTSVEKTPDVIEDEKRQLQTSSLETTSAEDSTDEGCGIPVIPFDKEHLTAQIQAGGGSVLSKLLPTSLAGANKKLFLISNTFQRTMKFFQCLVANIPSVSHTWIIHSCTQNQLLDYQSYVLPAGISLKKRAIVEKSPGVSCLSGYRVLLTSTQVEYLEMWTSVLEMARCKILSKFAANATGNRPGVDVVVADHTCVKSIQDKARQLGVPMVSSEWIIQCLINNSLQPHDGHPKYNHQYWKFVAKNSDDTD